jgi:hypothetical protein
MLDPASVVNDARAMAEHEDEDDSPLTVGDFHQIAQKQVMNAVFATLAETKMQWSLVEPMLQAGRGVCAGDFVENAEIRIHSRQPDGDAWVDAEEAYLGISVADREDGQEWLSETYWLSDLITQNATRDEVEAGIKGLERTIGRLKDWLANVGANPVPADPAPETPPAEAAPAKGKKRSAKQPKS